MPRFLRRVAGLAILGGLAAALAKRAGRPPEVTAGEAATTPPGPADSAAPGIRATPPDDAPGPSVTAPEDPAASIAAAAASVADAAAAKSARAGAKAAKAAAADARAQDPEATVEFDASALGPDPDAIDRQTSIESRLDAEEAAAAAEAGAIGGPHPRGEPDDPALRAVYEAGGGEAEGFEQAEEALIRNASHDDGGGKPLRDAFRPEAEADHSSGVYAEADRVESTEVVESDEESTGSGRPSDA